MHFLLGNHELAELTDYPIQKNRQMLNLLFRLGMQQMYGPATEKVREAYLPFIHSCPLAVRLPGGVFVCHSIPERCDARPFDRTVFTRALEPIEYLRDAAGVRPGLGARLPAGKRRGLCRAWSAPRCSSTATNRASRVTARRTRRRSSWIAATTGRAT